MYDDLIKRLRDAAKMSEALAVLLPHSEGNATAKLYNEASDTIEELSVVVRTQKAVLDKFPRWIPVTERLPERNTWVLAYCKYKDHVVDYVDINGLWSYGNVTHWMPLPQPPEEMPTDV